MTKEKVQERKVLVNVDKVNTTSLPWSLRNFSANGAVDDALIIMKFLQEVNYIYEVAEEQGEVPNNLDFLRGLGKVYGLLRDKLEIALGVYKFPFGSDDSEFNLAKRDEY